MKVLFLCLLAIAAVTVDSFSWESCGTTEYAVVNKLVISPDPLTFPGKVNYEVEVELKKPVKDVAMQLTIIRETFLLDVTLPCVKKIGSCSYKKMCSFARDMVKEDWGGIGAKIGGQALKKLDASGKAIDLCQTGLQPHIIKVVGTLDIPELPSILSFVAGGDYKVRLELTDNATGAQLACLEVKAKLKRKSTGWGKRRVRRHQLF